MKLIKNSTILNIYFLWLWIFCRYDNFKHIALSIFSFAINNIIYLNIYTYDVYLNVLKSIDREFLLWCSILTDRIRILIISFWRIECFRLFQISSTTFHQRISFDFESSLELLRMSNSLDWLIWFCRIKIILHLNFFRIVQFLYDFRIHFFRR
jgi:hypothetical protein